MRDAVRAAAETPPIDAGAQLDDGGGGGGGGVGVATLRLHVDRL